MRVLHVVPGLEETGNGIAVAAKLIADLHRKNGHEVDLIDTASFAAECVQDKTLALDEVWVHSMWLPETVSACRTVLRAGVPLVRMTHGNLDPLRMRSMGWKKYPVWWFVERRLTNKSSRVVATCDAEKEWNVGAGVRAPVEIVDLRQCFRLEAGRQVPLASSAQPIHVLFLGRLHPLKGLRFLKEAAKGRRVELHVVYGKTGVDLEEEWDWAEVLCLPTLSENFGLVVAEALERGKRVITTDGAPAWEGQPGVVYLKGFRDGTDEERVRLLKDALSSLR